MGAPLTIFRLYKLNGCAESHLLIRAVRPEFPNASQPAEDAAIGAVDAEFDSLLAQQKTELGFATADQIGTWEDGLPEGDVFYSANTGTPVAVWTTHDTKHKGLFAFGIAETETQFWQQLKELSDDGDLWGYEEFSRPAEQRRVWFVH